MCDFPKFKYIIVRDLPRTQKKKNYGILDDRWHCETLIGLEVFSI